MKGMKLVMEDSNVAVCMVGGSEPIKFNLAELPRITLDDTEKSDTKTMFYFDPQRDVKLTFKTKRISRKRFVRNMCSIGYTKKQAKRIAWALRIPYHIAWFMAVMGVFDENSNADRRNV